MRYARALSNYSHRGLTKVRDATNKEPLFDLVQPGQVFPCVYEYDERSEPQLMVLDRFGVIEFLPEGTTPERDAIAPQYFDPDVLATLPDEFKEAFTAKAPRKPKSTAQSDDEQE